MTSTVTMWAAALVVAVLATLLVSTAAVAARRSRSTRQRLAQDLAASQREVAQLADAVAHLADQVTRAGQRAEAEREYVITTLAEAADAAEQTGPSQQWRPPRRRPATADSVADSLERHAVDKLAEVDTATPWGARAAGAGVKALAFGHGLRRALSQENRDRASAEAHVARRRSRRLRRQELREARRLLRAVRAQNHPRPAHRETAGTTLPHPDREDAA